LFRHVFANNKNNNNDQNKMVGISGRRHRSRKISAAVGALAPPRGRNITRKQARKITTQFHRLIQQQQQTQQQQPSNDSSSSPVAAVGGTASTATTSIHDDEVEALRVDYQRASQVSTSYFSTSKWVLGCLIQNGWLYGIRTSSGCDEEGEETTKYATTTTTSANDDAVSHDDHGQERPSVSLRNIKKTKKKERRATRILEIGAINTELLDAAADATGRGAKLAVRAIDLHSMHTGRIEKADFLTMPLPNDNDDPPYDVVVCSMVLNCVATPTDRGTMLRRIHACLRPDGGTLFLTLPKTCLHLSPYINRGMLEDLLRAVGFTVHEHDKDSPKIAFFVATRNDNHHHHHPASPNAAADGSVQPKQWTQLTKIFRGSKYRNAFAVLLPPEVGS
jgi:hypothetical protein